MKTAPPQVTTWTPAEKAHLHMRVIALENLVIALLSDLTDAQRARARDMAQYISPRTGFTAHPLTLEAAAEMLHLIDRAENFKTRGKTADVLPDMHSTKHPTPN